MKNEILNTIKQQIPDKPYILFVGTSHTYGECEGQHTDSYAVYLSKMMGMECVNFGFSGAQNTELLQIVNELHMIDAFNENCKMVILEPRLTDNTVQIQYETWTEHHAVIGAFDSANDHNNPLIMKTAFGDDMNRQRNWLNETTVNDNLYRTVQQEQLNWNEFKEILNEYYHEGGKHQIDRFALNQEFKVAEQSLAMQAKTLASAFNDFVIIDSIKNMIVNKGIEFRWLLVDYRDFQIDLINYIYGDCTELMKYRLFNESARTAVAREAGANDSLDLVDEDPVELEPYVCQCHHFNQSGNKILGKLIYQEITGDKNEK